MRNHGSPQPDDIVIVSAARTAIGRFQGSLAATPAPELGATVLRSVLERAGLAAERVDEVLMGCVLQAGVGQAPARQASLAAGLPPTVGATTVNKVCGSGLKSVMLGAAMLRVGDASILLAGGMESMDQAPYVLPGARQGYRMGHQRVIDTMIHDGLWCAYEDQHMGNAAEWVARQYDISRGAMDEWAYRSHERALAALERGAFQDEIVPVEVKGRRGMVTFFQEDECPRRDTSLEKLARLRPVFEPQGAVTAGNSSAIADGAAAVAIMRREQAEILGCQPMARIVAYAQAAVEPRAIFTAPIYATQRVLDRANLTHDDIALYELNEAFASQVLANIQALHLDPERVNVNGGAIALGHPIGASGARVLVTLLYALQERQQQVGLASLCLGGGEAVAMIVEREAA